MSQPQDGGADVAAIPFMPLYVSDYLADTPHLSTEEHGAYLLLIMAYWQLGAALPDDDRRLARIARMDRDGWLAIRDDIAEFFTVEDGLWKHGRIDAEVARAQAKLEGARNAGKASAERRFNVRSTKAKRKGNHIQVEGEKREETPYSPPAGCSDETWSGFLEVRSKHPLTDRAYELICKTCAGGDAEAMIAQSVMNGWRGVFEVKGGRNGERRSAWL